MPVQVLYGPNGQVMYPNSYVYSGGQAAQYFPGQPFYPAQYMDQNGAYYSQQQRSYNNNKSNKGRNNFNGQNNSMNRNNGSSNNGQQIHQQANGTESAANTTESTDINDAKVTENTTVDSKVDEVTNSLTQLTFTSFEFDDIATSAPVAPVQTVSEVSTATKELVVPIVEFTSFTDDIPEAATTSIDPAVKPTAVEVTVSSTVESITPTGASANTWKEKKESAEWTRSKPLALPEEKPPGLKVDEPTATTTPREASSWRRAETLPVPINLTALLNHNDGVTRYDRVQLITLFYRAKESAPEIKEQYPAMSAILRLPFLPKGMKPPPSFDGLSDEIYAEEMRLFGGQPREGVFKFDPKLLENTDDPETIMRKANLILNKLSVTNFDKLSDELMAVGFNSSEEMLSRGVDLIVSKAQMEEHFCFMYADLCRKITDAWSSEEDKAAESAGADSTEDSTIKESLGSKFRVMLLERCRLEFEIDRSKQLEEIMQRDIPQDEKLEKEILLKRRFTGHMRFIGEICMKNLVKPKIMKTCLDSLLDLGDEEALVCLIKLFRTIGLRLEEYDMKKGKNYVQQTLSRVYELSENKELSSRIRFMLKDLLDMSRSGWQARREEVKATKLGDGKEDTSNTAALSNKSNASRSMQSKGPQDARAFGNKTSTSPAPAAAAADDWTTIPTKSGGQKKTTPMDIKTPAMSGSQGGGKYSANDKDMKKRPNQPSSSANFSNNNSGPGGQRNSSFNGASGIKNSASNTSLRSGSSTGRESNTSASTEDPVQSTPLPVSESEATINDTDADADVGSSDEDVEYVVPSKELLVKVRVTFEEYIANDNEEDTIQEIRSQISVKQFGDVFKSLVTSVVNMKGTPVARFNKFVSFLNSAGLAPSSEILRGSLLVLNDFDDLTIDYPLIFIHFASIVAGLVDTGLLNLSFLASIPEENNFSMSIRAHEFVATILHQLAIINERGVVVAEEAFMTIGEGFLKNLPAPVDDLEATIATWREKFDLPFFTL